MVGLKPQPRLNQTWLRPPRAVMEKVEALLELGKTDLAIMNHHSLCEYDISLGQIADIRTDYEAAREWEMKKRQELKEKEVEERRKSYSLSATPSKSPSKTSPSKSPGVIVGDSSQVLRGGPKTWPVEVLEHVHRLIDLGWSSSKVSNHYSLVCFGLTPQQVDLVRSMPHEKRQSAEKRSDGLSEESLQKVRQLILEGKTNTAVLNHCSLVNTNASEAQVQSVRTGIEKEAWRLSGTGTASSLSLTKSASKIKQPTLSKQEKDLIGHLISEGRSNNYISNYYALCDLGLKEYHVEGVRRAYLNDDDAQSPETLSRFSKTGQSPSSKGPPESPCTPEDEERLKKEHKERLRRKTAEKMMQQRTLFSASSTIYK